MYNMEPSQKQAQVTSLASIQQSTAVANVRLMLLCWWFIFSFAAVFQIVLWPTSDNIACVLLAWMSCIATGVVILRGRVTFLYPWSSLMVLMFCLSTCGFTLVLMLFQGDPLTFHLEVPVATFSHLLICQIVLLLIHLGYRNAKIWRRWEDRFRMKVLRPFGLLETPSWPEALAIGIIGLGASAYVYIILRDQNEGMLEVTGSVRDKFVEGLSLLSYAPLPLAFNQLAGRARKSLIFRLGFVVVYLLPILFISMAYNTRIYGFFAFANLGICLFLLLLSGKMRLHLTKMFIIGFVSFLILSTIGSDLSIAVRMARDDRAKLSSLNIVKETLQLMTVNRDELRNLRDVMSQGKDESEAWYVSSPVFSRLIYTPFQDRALAIALGLNDGDKDNLRHAEIAFVMAALPNPVLKILSDPALGLIDRTYEKKENDVAATDIGGYMLFLGGNRKQDGDRSVFRDQNGKLVGDVYAVGGLIGDGFGAYGWGYLIPFGGVAFVLFLFCDSLYGFSRKPTRENPVWISNFALVGLVNAYIYAASLTRDSIAELVRFTIRQPLQLLVVYGVVFWAVRFVLRALFGSKTKALQTRRMVIENPK